MTPERLNLIYTNAIAAAPIGASTISQRHDAGLKAVAEYAQLSKALSFQQFSLINGARAQRWHKEGGLEEWNIAEWTNAAAGEMGEACNASKKLRRIECHMQQHGGDSGTPANIEEAKRKIAKELGDTAVYLDLCAQRIGLTLEDVVRMAFNSVSEREGFPERV